MNANETAMPPPFVSPFPAWVGLPTEPSCRPEWKTPKPNGEFQDESHAFSIEELDPLNVAEIFKEELSYRVQARGFLWEFFD